MAKNCINTGCGKEIPSSATFCPFCGAQQVEDVQLSKEEKLLKEMSEMQETMTLLKKALADAQQNSDSSAEKEQAVENLHRKLAEVQEKKQKTIEENTIPSPIPDLKPSPTPKPMPAKNRIWLLLVFFFILVIGIVFALKQNDNRDNELSTKGKLPTKEKQSIEKVDTDAAKVLTDRQKIENFVRNYSQYTVDNNIQGLRNLYAHTVKRFHNVYDTDREYVIDCYEKYDRTYGVSGKHSSIRWNTLSIEQKNGLFNITYIEDYSIDSNKSKVYKNFVLEKHLGLNTNYQIVSVYEVIQSKSK